MKQTLDWQELLIVNFQRYRNEIITAVVALFLGLGAFEYQQASIKAKNQQLSELYIEYQNLAANGDTQAQAQILQKMQALSPKSVLTQLLRTQQAKQYLASGNINEAIAIYTDLIANCEAPFCDLYQIRTALIHLNKKDAELAIKHLNAVNSETYKYYKAMFLGDAMLLQGKRAEAIKSWESAYSDLNIKSMNNIEKGIKEQLAFRLQKAHS